MDNRKDDFYYINKILKDLDFLIKHTKEVTKEALKKDEVLLDSVMFRFIQISEHIKKLTLVFKTKHKEIPWKDIVGLRNRIVHDYGTVDLSIIYYTVKKDIYIIHKLFKAISRD